MVATVIQNGTMKIKIGIVDDQKLFVKSLFTLVNTFPRFAAIVDAIHGEDLLKKLAGLQDLPDIILLDVNMPVMDGVQTATRLSEKYPGIKTVALSMKDDDITIIGMLRAGCCAYLLKDIDPDELERALEEIGNKGYYNGDIANINYRRLILSGQRQEKAMLTPRETHFVQLACSELTYKQIAAQMGLAERTIDGYREAVFEKFNVQSRVGMAMEAIRRGLVAI